ncbi:MAG: methionine adenosyltransferase, partial [Lapillicoccus sp.]
VDALDLLRPIYKPTAAYGHFGRTSAPGVAGAFPWEQTNRIEALQAAVRG